MNDKLTGCAARAPQVVEQVQRLDKAVGRIAEVRSNIEERLSSVLRPSTPIGGEPGKEKAQVVPLAGELERLTEQINGITLSMENMLSRVEL